MDEREVRVDWCTARRLPQPALDESESWLDDAERTRLAGFLRADSRRDFLIGRWLARRALARHTGVVASAWRFELGPLGRPRPHTAATPAGPTPDVNITHGGGVVACVSLVGAEVGVDVESTDRALPGRRLERFLAPAEFEALCRCDEADQAERFWRFWTLKEAYLKARGTGISGSLSSFEVRIRDSAEPDVVGIPDSPRWRLTEFRLPGQIVGAVAVHAVRALPVRVALIEVPGTG